MTNTALPATSVEALPLLPAPTDLLGLLTRAVDRGIDAEALERLVALKERIDAQDAAREFAAALAAFQAECPTVARNKEAKIVTKGGSSFSYTYADLDGIARAVGPHLHKHGFSYTWDSSISDAGALSCVCTLRHKNGHSESSSFACPIDSASRMSGAQASKAALTFARRCSLTQVLGITDADDDPDAPRQEDAEGLTAAQVAEIEAEIERVGADRDGFLTFASSHVGVECRCVEDIPRSHFRPALNALKAKGGGA